jgi:hypothetical protein
MIPKEMEVIINKISKDLHCRYIMGQLLLVAAEKYCEDGKAYEIELDTNLGVAEIYNFPDGKKQLFRKVVITDVYGKGGDYYRTV